MWQSLAFYYLGIYFQDTLLATWDTTAAVGKHGEGQTFIRKVNKYMRDK